jgi:hypothetical protein
MAKEKARFKRIIGFRAEVQSVNWALVEGCTSQPRLIEATRLEAPRSYDEPEGLGWFRQRVTGLIQQFAPEAVIVRTAERARGGGQSDGARRRLRLEGVVAESGASFGLPVRIVALVTISSNFGERSVKDSLADDEFRGLDWADYSDYEREAILAAASFLVED